ncbi:uncharacterized protein RSE6_01331 [Rhynchosporium secalis]|uniref:Transcription initiation factor TFIID subunit 8 n=1 Tax=Rhynchosporium secalis TaxID=38038 RepID=A0A1E1LXI9_RHYSE|nr:uncharacterized protein RSE6_01331 [Rhynchosporium secalis]
MAPISPVESKKRASPSQSDNSEEPTSKRRRYDVDMPQSPPVEPPESYYESKTEKVTMFDEDPHNLLLRAIALSLEHVGFTGASSEALEEFCAEVDVYAAQFLSRVTSSMLNARRSLPTPLDFKYALSEFDLPIASIEPHLRPPIPASKLLLQLEPASPVELAPASLEKLLGDALSGEAEKKVKPYIPKRFPAFPSKHTFKWTERDSGRETNPRRVREEAAKLARQSEEALRRLTKVAKAGKEKDVKKAASKDPKSKARHEMWEKTIGALSTDRVEAAVKEGLEDNDRGLIVNADRSFHRKGTAAKKKPPLPVIEGL